MNKARTKVYKVCVVTSVPAAREPRAPKHVVAVLEAMPDAEVYFVDMMGLNENFNDPLELQGHSHLHRLTLRVPTRKSAPIGWAFRKFLTLISSRLFVTKNWVTPGILGARAVGLAGVLRRVRADLYIAHNIETLMPTAIAAKANRAKLIFDCMEFYGDMGDSQTTMASAATKHIEAAILPRCDLVLATSESLAEALSGIYKIPKPLVLQNVPPIIRSLPEKRIHKGLRLYWRNSTIGFGQRGLDDALVALTLLPTDIVLSIQGRLRHEDARPLYARIHELNLTSRVTILSEYALGEAVAMAALHDAGLCLERRGPANHEYTTSNKLFDYMMAGLAVIVPDLDGLSRAVKHAGAGLIYKACSPQSLAEKVLILYRNPTYLKGFAEASRAYAMAGGNLEHEMTKLKVALLAVAGANKL